MISFKCPNCAGEMSVSRQGDLLCEYCGHRGTFSDKELTGYHEFRQRVLNFLKNTTKSEEAYALREDIWNRADTTNFTTADGVNIAVRYIYTTTDKHHTMFLARNTAIYVFDKASTDAAKLIEVHLSMLSYPPADIKGLDKCFPKVTGVYSLSDGRTLVSMAINEDFYPLGMFGSLQPETCAWIVSRMENICCVLEYSNILHSGFSSETIFINPFTHQAMLVGGWEAAYRKPATKFSVNADLLAIRKTAEYIMSDYKNKAPLEFKNFLSERPDWNAYDDFTRWDTVIEKGFGGRRFVKMNINI